MQRSQIVMFLGMLVSVGGYLLCMFRAGKTRSNRKAEAWGRRGACCLFGVMFVTMVAIFLGACRR